MSDKNPTIPWVTSEWTFISVFHLTTTIVGFVGNGGLLLLFLTDRTLRNTFASFNIYAINLLITNLCCILVSSSMSSANHVYSASVWYLGESACTVFLYGLFSLEGVVVNGHALIAVVRVWAIVRAASYRTVHNVRVAMIACIGVWVYVHLVTVPGIVMDAMYYRRPVETHGCHLHSTKQPKWAVATDMIIFKVPLAIILLAFPIIYFSRIATLRRLPLSGVNVTGMSLESRANMLHMQGGDRSRGSWTCPSGLRRQRMETRKNGADDTLSTRTKRWRISRKYLLLAALTISVTICWAPSIVFFAMVYLLPNFWDPRLFQVAMALFSCQTMLDPLLIVLTFVRVRQALERLLKALSHVMSLYSRQRTD